MKKKKKNIWPKLIWPMMMLVVAGVLTYSHEAQLFFLRFVVCSVVRLQLPPEIVDLTDVCS